MEIRKVLAYLAIKRNGDWFQIFDDIKNKRMPTSYEEMETVADEITCGYVTIMDEEYPTSLKNIFRPPFVLFYYGDITLLNDASKRVAVVGSRENSEYGATICDSVIKEISSRYIIVSGLADGIDSLAHKAAIESGNKTIAILGTGIDRCYPINNKDIYDEIKTNHLLLSEYPGRCQGSKDTFPRRNRIISGISSGVVVVEAKMKSGTMITATHALEQGKEIACFPALAIENSGCNHLIKNGATLVENAEDIYLLLDSYAK